MGIVEKLKIFFTGKRAKKKEMNSIEEVNSKEIIENEQVIEEDNIQEDKLSKEIRNVEIVQEAEEEIKYSSDETNSEDILYDKLKKYRTKKSKEENLVEHFVFKNKEIEDIIKTRPKTIVELKSIRGFGEVKCRKYGEDIISIINEN